MLRIEHNVTIPKSDPQRFIYALDDQMDGIARYIAEAMSDRIRKNGSEMFGTLAKSVHVERPGPLARLIAPGVNYARAVDEGTGPATGKARYTAPPPIEVMEVYVRTHARRSRVAAGKRLPKAGSKARARFDAEIRDRAAGLSRFIYQHGTKAHPFIEPTVNAVSGTAQLRLAQAAQKAAQALLEGGG